MQQVRGGNKILTNNSEHLKGGEKGQCKFEGKLFVVKCGYYPGISLERLCKTTSEPNRIRNAHFRIYVQVLPMHQQLWLPTS